MEPPKHLRKNILLRIGQEERRRARVFLATSFSTALLSIVGIIFSIQYLIQSFYQSSFYSYLSLLFSDPDIALAYWKEFTLSLIETVPLFEITTSLAAVAVLMVSVRVFATNVRGLQFSLSN